MKTYDKSLTEVWEWKEKVGDETEGLSPVDYVKKMRDDGDGPIRLGV